MNIFLCGFMGSGKSTLMKKLKESAGDFQFIDLDEEILKRHGEKNHGDLGEMILARGWDFFRQKEGELIREWVAKDNFIVSLGGGALSDKRNLEAILNAEGNALVFLDTPFEECWERIKDQTHRPLVQKGREALEKLYSERLAHYRQANLSLDNDAQAKLASPLDLMGLLKL